jgi:23S rRNA pseudouridine2605 synthase
MAKQRLQRVLAAAGVASRRQCEALILEGVVRVNRQVVDQLPAFVDPDKDLITVNNQRIKQQERVYYLLNKPKGVICTNADPRGRKRAVDLVPSKQRVFCAGRLDTDTTGLIIITNDNMLTNRLTHPRYGLTKRYVVTVKGAIDQKQIERLKRGVWLSEGQASASMVKVLKRGPEQSTLQISLKQGLNRQIRRMLAGVGLNVKDLKRTRIGRLDIRGLGLGRYRTLTQKEIEYLKKATGMS